MLQRKEFPWRRRSVHTGWWPRPCWTASMKRELSASLPKRSHWRLARDRPVGDRRYPGGAHVDGVALGQAQRLGVAPSDLSDERSAGRGAGQLDAHLETEHHHAVDGGADDSGGLGGAVAGGDLHI